MQYCSIVIRLITLSRRSQQPVCSVVEFCLFGSHLQNSSTDVSAAGLTFHPILGVVIRLAVGHSIPATHTIKTVTCAKKPELRRRDDGVDFVSCLCESSQSCTFENLIFFVSSMVRTHLLMYSPVRTMLHVRHLKQLTCHCFSSARRD